jgi:hypothetical protein
MPATRTGSSLAGAGNEFLLILRGKDFLPQGYISETSYGARAWFEKCVREARTVQELMEYKTTQMTLGYAHPAPQHQLAAVQRLCDTITRTEEEPGVARNGATRTRTSTGASEVVEGGAEAVQ